MDELPVEKFKPIIILNSECIDENAIYNEVVANLNLLGDEGKIFIKLPECKISVELYERIRELLSSYLETRESLKILVLYDDLLIPEWEDEELKTYIKKVLFPDIIMAQQGLFERKGESFSAMLFRLIKEKGISEVDCYKKANLDRRIFSKIRSDEEYRPSKATVLSLALALELKGKDFKALLESAGFALSNFYKEDVIIAFFINKGIYDIFRINEALFENGCRPLGF